MLPASRVKWQTSFIRTLRSKRAAQPFVMADHHSVDPAGFALRKK